MGGSQPNPRYSGSGGPSFGGGPNTAAAAAGWNTSPISPVGQDYTRVSNDAQPMHIHPQQQQQQGAHNQMGMGATFFGTQFLNDPTTAVAAKFGEHAFQQGSQMVNQNINRYVNVPRLKYFFNVSNSYVLNKVRLILFPFRQKFWTRLVNRSEQDGQMEGYKPPREDLNAPDLYIPVMSFVTYVLLVGLLLGSGKDGRTFAPDALGATSTSGLFVVLFELLTMKLGCYFLNVNNEVPMLDVIAYSGYKFVGINLVIVIKIFFAAAFIYSVFAYVMLSFGFFTLRTLKYLVLPESTNSTVMVPQRQRRIYFLFAFVGVQIFFLVLAGL